jgi:hypothetical protein
MFRKNKLNNVQISSVSPELFQPHMKTTYQSEFSEFYYRSPSEAKILNEDVVSKDLYIQDSKIERSNKKGLIQVQDCWSKSYAQKKYHEDHPPDQINYSQGPVCIKTGKKLCLLSPGIMYKDVY